MYKHNIMMTTKLDFQSHSGLEFMEIQPFLGEL